MTYTTSIWYVIFQFIFLTLSFLITILNNLYICKYSFVNLVTNSQKFLLFSAQTLTFLEIFKFGKGFFPITIFPGGKDTFPPRKISLKNLSWILLVKCFFFFIYFLLCSFPLFFNILQVSLEICTWKAKILSTKNTALKFNNLMFQMKIKIHVKMQTDV